ncbi:asparaginase [Asanoa ishikariensis]|uniref:Asparaginase n=1 Tax=Asanoa ishikariensis TaxID=137265 RepID=A0A1H3QJV1_9ACTN|nr:asparaginase [Asanoa ishikariensis]GIF64980.1 asparaginase [Asanoa ishikariensis]SDZ13308.1 asparaginase [Asanoa ishikariensis]
MGKFYEGGVRLTEVVRSGFSEGYHHGSVVVLDASGNTVAATGDVESPMFPRSSNKPMQAVGMLRAGLRLTDSADLALVCASHWGQDIHVNRAAAMLRSAGLDESALRCPPDLPLDPAAAADVIRAGGGPSRIQMNCSGKHTGMLLTCVAAGWPTEGYLSPEHPLQKSITAAVADLAGEDVVATAVDGCGAPLLGISLTALARAFGTLVEAAPGTAERSVADAMRAHPELVSGTDTVEQKLMAAVPGMLVKAGAEGVMAVAVPGAGAVAIKMDDGAHRGNRPVLVSALRRIGVTGTALEQAAQELVLGGGETVGELHSTW